MCPAYHEPYDCYHNCYSACAHYTSSIHCDRDCSRICCETLDFKRSARGEHWTTAFSEGSLHHAHASTKNYYHEKGAACYHTCEHNEDLTLCGAIAECDRKCYTIDWESQTPA